MSSPFWNTDTFSAWNVLPFSRMPASVNSPLMPSTHSWGSPPQPWKMMPSSSLMRRRSSVVICFTMVTSPGPGWSGAVLFPRRIWMLLFQAPFLHTSKPHILCCPYLSGRSEAYSLFHYCGHSQGSHPANSRAQAPGDRQNGAKT